eukprot:gene3233-5943_t
MLVQFARTVAKPWHLFETSPVSFLVSRALASKAPVELIKELRQKTNLPIKLCRQALVESDGSLTGAIEWIEKNESARAQKMKEQLSSRNASEGRIGLSASSSAVALVQINCETDFVARNEKFRQILQSITDSCLTRFEQQTPSHQFSQLSEKELESLPVGLGTARNLINDALASLRENLQLSRACGISLPPSSIAGTYNHNNGIYIGAVCLDTSSTLSELPINVREQIQGVADKIAQNIVAVEPVLEDGMSEVEALLKQPLVFTPQQTVANMIAAVADKTGIRLSLMSWARWQK